MSPAVGDVYATRGTMFEAALEVLPEMVLIHDEELILFANAACRRFLRATSPADLEGRPIDVIVHPDAYAAGRERRRLLLESGNAFRDVPLKIVGLDGNAVHVIVDAIPIAFNGTRAGMVVVRNGRVG